MSKLTKKETVLIRWLEDGNKAIIYDYSTGVAYLLNKTAARIFELCDGHHSIEDIYNKLFVEFKSDRLQSSIMNDVLKFMQKLKRLQLVERL